MGETVRVVVRCRPMNKRETAMKCKNIVAFSKCEVSLSNPQDPTAPVKGFTYDSVYGPEAPTEAIYNDICYGLIENVLEGYNGTIFAYGQTGCGKSHTMQGPECADPSLLPSSQRGIISRAFDHIFEAISVASDVRYLVLVSYLEIYNENIRDLLQPCTESGGGAQLSLKELPGEGVVVQNLSTHAVHNARECEQLLRAGMKNRIVGSTLMNTGSSRSHSIFTISLEQIDTKSNLMESGSASPGIRKGKLNLVDLAGSERQNKTGATGDRLKEASKINLSLSALGNVISALVDGKTKHIPYRDSKLTRLLQDSLGGNTKTLMVACISPADYNYDETLSTLRYANRAKNIQNKPHINEDPKDTMLKEYQREILELRKLLEANGGPLSSPNQNSWLDQEGSKLRAQYEAETSRLKAEYDAQQKEKEDLVRDMEALKVHYEEQFKDLAKNEMNKNMKNTRPAKIQQEALNRIEAIKNALVGGERANDSQLKENRYKKKLAAQSRLSALAQALSRVEEGADRDLLQEHYSDIQHELRAKTESIKVYRIKIRALEREISDLQSEFQLDRADYLDTIRRLERNLKFYQQLLDLALPILRKDGKYWDPDLILQESAWNDDLRKWKLPEESLNRFRLPPAASAQQQSSDRFLIDQTPNDSAELNSGDYQSHVEDNSDDIAGTYFRPRRAIDSIHQRKGFNSWREDFASKQQLARSSGNLLKTSWSSLAAGSGTNSVLASWLPQSHLGNGNGGPLSRTWCGLSAEAFPVPRPSPPSQLTSGQLLETASPSSLPSTAERSDFASILTRRRTRIKSTGPLVILGHQRRLRHVETLEGNCRINT